MNSRAGLVWQDTHAVKAQNLREFNLKVGDRIIFPDFMLDNGNASVKGRLNVGTVVGIYPYIFHVSYQVGAENDITLYRSFRKVSYQLGEVTKYDS